MCHSPSPLKALRKCLRLSLFDFSVKAKPTGQVMGGPMSFNPNGNQVSPLNRQSEGYNLHPHGDSFCGPQRNSILENSNDQTTSKESSNG